MPLESPRNNLLARSTIPPQTLTDGTVNGTGVDRVFNGVFYRSALVVVHAGTITDGTHTVEVQESDDNSTFTAVAATDLEGTEPAIGSTDDDTVFEIGYTGTSEFIRAAIVTTGATSGGLISAAVVLNQPSNTVVR